MKILSLSLLIFINFNALAYASNNKALSFDYPNYEKASRAGSYVRFDMNSSLLGFITAHFSGFAKKFELSWTQTEDEAKDLQILIPVSYMDTNKKSRTEEMQIDSFEMETYKNILVKIIEPVPLKLRTIPVTAEVNIRGKKSLIKFNLTLEKLMGQWQISSQIPVTLSQLNILSPTIAKGLASFDNNVRILFNFRI